MDSIEGTWRLVGAKLRDDVGNPRPLPYEGQGMGRIVIGGGRMAVMMIDWRREVPSDQKRVYSGYTGTYTYDGKQLVTTVDASPDSRAYRHETASGGAVRKRADDPDPATPGSGGCDRTR